MAQVPAEKRIKVADTLRLFFHFFNILNLTVGLIVCGVGVSLIASPLPLDISEEISIVYGVLLLTAIVVILMGVLGIHGCYRVQDTGLKIYALAVVIALVLEIVLGTLTVVKRSDIEHAIERAVLDFKCSGMNGTNFNCTVAMSSNETEALERARSVRYSSTESTAYRHTVDMVHEQMSCCSFKRPNPAGSNVSSCYFSLYHQLSEQPYQNCTAKYTEYIDARLNYMQYLAFILVPVQIACLVFDLLVLKTLKVTKDYEKLERELSNRRRQGQPSQQALAPRDSVGV